MDDYREVYKQAAAEAIRWLRAEPLLECLPADVQRDTVADVLATLFFRKIVNRRDYNRRYLSCLLTYQRKRPHRSDAFVVKARRRAAERVRWGMQTDQSSLAMSRRSTFKEPIEELIEAENREIEKGQLQKLERELRHLNSRERAVMDKFLRAETLTQVERCVKHRIVEKLRERLGIPYHLN